MAIDVLEVMAQAHKLIQADIDYGEHSLDYYQLAVRLPEARSAVAELIDAIEEHAEADGHYEATAAMYGDNSNSAVMKGVRGRVIRAARRLRAAMAGVRS